MPRFERYITVTLKVEGEYPDIKTAITALRDDRYQMSLRNGQQVLLACRQ